MQNGTYNSRQRADSYFTDQQSLTAPKDSKMYKMVRLGAHPQSISSHV